MKKKKLHKLIAKTVAEAMAAALAGAAKEATAKKKPISAAVMAQSRAKRTRKESLTSHVSRFAPAKPGPGVLPEGHDKPVMAMDNAFLDSASWAGQALIDNALYEGTAFLGYAYLALLAQRPEYRVISETIATEATREWIKLQSASDPAGDPQTDPEETKKKAEAKAAKIKAIEAEFDRLKVQDAFRLYSEQDGFFGRSHLYLDTGATDDRDELITSIGGGNDATSKGKVNKDKPLLALRNVEAVWVYPANYDSTDPLKPAWFNPETWFVQGKEVHRSRLLTGVAREVPDLLKPQYAFGGLSASQMVKPYVDAWLKTKGSVNDLISAFSQMILSTDLSETLSGGGADQLDLRADLFNNYRDNRNLMLVSKDSEEVKNVVTPLGTLDALQAQSQEHMASVSRIPLVKLLGIQPAGLNASSEGELITFEDMIRAYQKKFFGDPLNRVLWFVQLSLFGEVDPSITVEFNPLRQMTEKERGEIDKSEAEADQTRIDSGVLEPVEVRRALAGKEDSRYHDIDVEDVPDLQQEEDEGLEPGGGDDPGGGNREGGGGDSALIPFASGATDAVFSEEDHPRAPDGKFGSGGGSSKPLDPKKLEKVGAQMGSNPGGVFKDEGGKQFYVKKGQSAAHVRNELTAARLYALAGSPTLNYRHVEGGGHIATEMSKLDKDRSGKLSPAEVKEAQKHFASHAWLANWDAAGTGGDNLGTVNGVPTALDLGGALQYRAQGAPKGSAFGEKVGEIDTLRDPSISPDAAKVFAKMTPAQLKESAQRVTSISDDDIRATVKAGGEGEDLAEKLIARKRDIAKRFGIAEETNSTDAAKVKIAAAPSLPSLDWAIGTKEAGLPVFDGTVRRPKDYKAKYKAAIAAGKVENVPLDKIEAGQGYLDRAKLLERMDDVSQETMAKHPAAIIKQDGKFILVDATHRTAALKMRGDKTVPSVVIEARSKTGAKDEFNPADHPHAPAGSSEGGQFVSGGGGTGSSSSEAASAKPGEHVPPGSKKKGAFGGLFKTQGSNPKLNHHLTVSDYLAKPAKSGSHYRNMLAHLIKSADEHGYGDKVPALKEKLGQAFYNAGQTMLEQAKTATPGSHEFAVLTSKYENAIKKAKEYGWKSDFELSQEQNQGLAQKLIKQSEATPAAKAPQATPDELKKAKKNTPLPLTSTDPVAVAAIKAFNEKYAGKEISDPAALNQKVVDHKGVTAIAAEGQQKQQAEAVKQQAAAQNKAANAAKAEAEAYAKKFDTPEAKEHFETLSGILNGSNSAKQYLAHAETKLKSAGLEGKMTATEAAMVIAYSGSHYREVNQQLRAGVITEKQYAFTKALNQALDKMPAYTKTTYRKADLTAAQAAQYKPGFIVPERGFTSSAKHDGVWSGSHHYVIEGKGGRDIQKLSSHPGESEVLFKANSHFMVVKVEGKKIHLREMD